MDGSDETTVLEAVDPHPEVALSNTLNLVEAYTIEGFIEEVKSRPCLWNTSLRVYKEPHRKRIAWDEIAKKFAKDGSISYHIQLIQLRLSFQKRKL